METMGQATAGRAASIDEAEVAKFAAMAEAWWDPEGKFRPLHRFNPVRLAYIRDRLCGRFGRDPKADRPLQGLALLDVGCGGGLLSEPRSEEHTSELQSLMRISYAVFCLKKKKQSKY